MERFEEARRWFLQALRDLKAARDSRSSGNYEWAAFQAQQAAEKALKALLYAHGESAWGHSVLELLSELKRHYNDVDMLMSGARELDRHYIPSRYPNVYESGYPGEYYDDETASRTIRYSEAIIGWVQKKLNTLGLKL